MGSSQSSSDTKYEGPVFANKMTAVTVYYGANWDGGDQERAAVTRFVMEVIPDAVVTPKKVSRVEIRVEIDGQEVFKSAQREFFGKNGHRGRGKYMTFFFVFHKMCVRMCLWYERTAYIITLNTVGYLIAWLL